MAVLRSSFATQSKSVCHGSNREARWSSRRPSFQACLAAVLLMLAVPVCEIGYGAVGQQTNSAAPSRPAAHSANKPSSQVGASQQEIELVNQGNELMDRKDYAGAESEYKKALLAYPQFAAAHRGLGIALWRQRKMGRAWQELTKVSRLEPDSAQAHFDLGQLAWEIYNGNPAASNTGLSSSDYRSIALSEVQKAVLLKPHDFNMRVQLSQMELAAGQQKAAKADAKAAASLGSSAAERASAHVALAQAQFSSGDELNAEAEYKKAIQEDPSIGTAYLGLGQIALFQQHAAQAQQYFTQAIHVSPGLGPAYAALGKLYLQGHQLGEAVMMLRKAVALDPTDWHSRYELGKILMQSGESARAKEMFTKILAARPDFLPAAEQLALMHLRQGDVAGAITQAQALLSRNPQALQGHQVLALAYWRERQFESSLAECAQVLALDPQSISMQALQALELWQTKHHGDARRILRDLARKDPSILSAVTFCRQIVCGSGDVKLVGDFLHDNRWILETPANQ